MSSINTYDLLLPTSVLLLTRGAVWAFDLQTQSRRPEFESNRFLDQTPCTCHPHQSGDVEPSRPAMLMTQAVYTRMLADLLRQTPEAGGALIGPKDTELITHYLPNNGEATETSFTLDHTTLNKQLASLRDAGLDLKGIVHSHPSGVHSPSSGDRAYLERLLTNPKNRSALVFSFPIVCDGRLWPYVAVRTDDDEIVLRSANLILI